MKSRHSIQFHRLILFIAIGISLLSVNQSEAKAPFLNAEELTIPPPKIIRTCCSFGADIGISGIPFIKKTDITSINEIGAHHYLGNIEENNGNIYTKRGGFLDLGHLRDCADWTAYLYQLILASKENHELEIIRLGNEGGSKILELKIPEDFEEWEAVELAGKIAYDLSLWHEIATWYGTSYVPLLPERYSSFSPEDLYSNLLGVRLGMEAIKSELEYDEAMTFLLSEMLDHLDVVQTQEETYDAMVRVDDIWYTSQKRLPNKKLLVKRYLDPDSFLTPWLVPGLESYRDPVILNKPDPALSYLYELQVNLNFRFPVKTIFPNEKNKTITQNEFSLLTEQIQKELKTLDERREIHLQKVENRKEKRNN